MGEYITALVPIDKLSVLSERQTIIFISENRKKKMLLDNARKSVNADSVYLGEGGLAKAYKGNNVIVGVVDSGLDISHNDFKDSVGGSRVLYLWDQTADAQFGPTEIPNSFGIEWSKEQIDNNVCNQIDDHGHGTHVAGIAAGNGAASSDVFRGMAPEADIIFVKTDFENDVDGVNYIFKKAEALGRPAVVNMSLGGHFGPHDGTSNYERSLEVLTGRGKILVVAAGNEGMDKIHYSDVATSTPKYVDFKMFDVSANIELWYDNQTRDKNVTLTFQILDNNNNPIAALGPLNPGMYLERDFDFPTEPVVDESETFVIADARLTLDPNNYASLVSISYGSKLKYTLRIIYTGNTKFDMWLATNGAVGEFEQGDTYSTIGAPGTVASAITVAAYTTKTEWWGQDGNYHYQYLEAGWPTHMDNIASFSSRGPSRRSDWTGLKPNISAPGEIIFSTFSSSSNAQTKNKDMTGKYVKMEGTSMATPAVTGIVALMLQANPNLNPAEVKEILKKSANTDAYTGAVPNVIWGNGKINALAALLETLNIVIDTTAAVYIDTSSSIISSLVTANTAVAQVLFDSQCAGGNVITEKVKSELLNYLADGSVGDTIILDLEFKDRNLPITMTVKNIEDASTRAKVDAAENSIIDFGGGYAYQVALKTVRDISFIRNGAAYNSASSFNKARITYNVPAGLRGYPLAVYYLDETDSRWKIVNENNISYSANGDTVSAELTHFSIYGLFAKGVRSASDFSELVIFPNPFRPNDGNELTGLEFTGSYNINNKTGIHISGLIPNSSIKIYDINGRLVAELQPILGTSMAIWDARMKDGRLAPTGLYLVLIENAGQKRIEKLAIVR